MLREEINLKVINAARQAAESGELGQTTPKQAVNLVLEKPKNPEHGDFAVNVSSLARYAKMPPPKIAETIAKYIDIEDVETSIISGFINFRTGNSKLNSCIEKILDNAENFGRNNLGNSEKVILEYVSANPTGPLHIGHGRWAATGSALANLLKFSGYDIYQEFYINDAGNQMNNLVESFIIRIYEVKGYGLTIPENEKSKKKYYPGEYLIELARKYCKDNPEGFKEILYCFNVPEYYDELGCYIILGSEYASRKDQSRLKNLWDELTKYVYKEILEQQKALLNRMRVHFDNWFSETSLYERNEVKTAIHKLEESGKLYEKDSAVWFKSSDYGDDQDRVIVKQDGNYTYLTADIAYHYDKIIRGFDRLINIWGADHHGYVARVKASIEALGKDSNCLEILLGQMVNLIVSGEQMRMGKRTKMITLEELVDEVGVDGTRYWMIMRDINNTLDFDVELAKSCSDENPVYYVQYAHARACSILRTSVSERVDRETGETLPPLFENLDFELSNLDALWQEESEPTRNLVLQLESFEDAIEVAARNRTPYMVCRYVQDLAKDFHHFYTFTRVLNVEENVMKARLRLVQATKQVLKNAFDILGVSAPEQM